jgi:hypothetical protein
MSKVPQRSHPRALARSPKSALAAGPAVAPNSIVTRAAAFIEPERRTAMVAECAYYRAEKRGFEAGYELDDWLAAEVEIDRKLLPSGDVRTP